ncbi:uncharacterized protein K452DRAFT_303419 [Aplosporella prunicola CBS 121167]|uniref:Uncharacterized protein n=1 Tax=Aplosporella prunicola CBS 121167 TaxID=1176127 RepID=A0A6A6AXY3_9PEZI|nr:uncharacterized protein K452DRAFT_303419 [Aplosporella prunicola CBS 121167]KAF2135627.1 hypothetical protein K452DRAFT_303419 [Aplosporella prunicola CBS 121167]
MPSVTEISPRQSSPAIVNMDGPAPPTSQPSGYHLSPRHDPETFSQFLRDAEALDGTVSNASVCGKPPVRGLYPAHAKLFCAAMVAALATLVSAVVAGSALVINKDANDDTKLGYVIWLTLSIVSCMGFGGIAFIFWRQRKAQRWVQRRLAFLEIAKYRTELEKKNTSEAANHPHDSRPQVRTEADFVLQSPPTTHERAERTERAQSSSAATSSSRATGEGYELRYIRSHLSDASESEQPLRPIPLPPRTVSMKTWRHSTEPTLVGSPHIAPEPTVPQPEPVQVLTSSTPSLILNTSRTSSLLPPARIDSQFWESLKPLQPREHTEQPDASTPPRDPSAHHQIRPSSQTLPESHMPLLDAHVNTETAGQHDASELDFGFSADMELDPDDTVIIHTLHASSSIDPLPANTPTLLATTPGSVDSTPRRDSHIDDSTTTATITLTNTNATTTTPSKPSKPNLTTNDAAETPDDAARRNSLTLLLNSPHRPLAQLSHSLPTEHGSPSPFIVSLTPPTPTKPRHRRLPEISFRERLQQCRDASASGAGSGNTFNAAGGGLALPLSHQESAGAGAALSMAEMEDLFPSRVTSLCEEEQGEDVSVLWSGVAFGTAGTHPSPVAAVELSPFELQEYEHECGHGHEREHEREHEYGQEGSDEDSIDADADTDVRGKEDDGSINDSSSARPAHRWEGVVPYEGT